MEADGIQMNGAQADGVQAAGGGKVLKPWPTPQAKKEVVGALQPTRDPRLPAGGHHTLTGVPPRLQLAGELLQALAIGTRKRRPLAGALLPL
jgi:hypothetical protein